MRAFEWRQLRVDKESESTMRLTLGAESLDLQTTELLALGDALSAVARLHGAKSPRRDGGSPSHVGQRRGLSDREVEVTKPGPLKTIAALRSGESTARTLTVAPPPPTASGEGPDREVSKPGPIQTSQQFNSSRPDGDELDPKTEATTPNVQPQANDAGRRRKGSLLPMLVAWMETQGVPSNLSQMVAAAEREGWTDAQNLEASISGLLRRHADQFVRNPDGTFALRSARRPARLVRRRSARHDLFGRD